METFIGSANKWRALLCRDVQKISNTKHVRMTRPKKALIWMQNFEVVKQMSFSEAPKRTQVVAFETKRCVLFFQVCRRFRHSKSSGARILLCRGGICCLITTTVDLALRLFIILLGPTTTAAKDSAALVAVIWWSIHMSTTLLDGARKRQATLSLATSSPSKTKKLWTLITFSIQQLFCQNVSNHSSCSLPIKPDYDDEDSNNQNADQSMELERDVKAMSKLREERAVSRRE